MFVFPVLGSSIFRISDLRLVGMIVDLYHLIMRILVIVFAVLMIGAECRAQELVPSRPSNLSLRKELARAIDRGCDYLIATQSEDGTWSDGDYTAVTSLSLVALQGDPEERHSVKKGPVLRKGYDYLLKSVQADGGVYRIDTLMNYNTAVSVMALVAANDPAFNDEILNARRWLIRGQQDFGVEGQVDHVLDGGFGYGDGTEKADMSNTVLSLEALYYTKHLVQDTGASKDDKLDWDAAIQFLQRCQNLPGSNPLAWASDDEANKGGFVYNPSSSKAGEVTLPDGRVALRSYASISYAGLLSYIYADLGPQDSRVEAVVAWLEANYTLDENPGMGMQGLYYYYYTMSKALTLAGVQDLETKDGQRVYWAKELALKMLDLQRQDGSWFNDTARWWEKEPALVTAYALLTLENLYRVL